MKRISLILLCGLLFNALAVAQTRVSSPGGGVQVVSDSNTENSRTMVISTKSGEEIEVTVTNLTSLEPPPGSGSGDGEDQPIKITIYNYVETPKTTPQAAPPADVPVAVPAFPPGIIPQVQPMPAPPPRTIFEVPTTQVPAYPSTPSYQVRPMRIIPGLPDPYSNRSYYLQVGSYTAQDAAAVTAQFLIRAGFNIVYERDGYNIRVLVPSVPASMVHSTIQRLGSLGIGEIWVR